ncbi:MAG: hydrogenase/urease accessory protein HupE [Halioglobus sp.]|jgi:hydrogenase/urease accessory protein HupE
MKFVRLALALLVLLSISVNVQAHRFAPSLLKLVETSQGSYNVVWKTPTQGTSSIPLRPIWPEGCEVSAANPVQQEGTGSVSSWAIDCSNLPDGALVGQTLGVSGLGANQASAMVLLSLKDGRNYQQVVNAEKSEFVVPAEPGQGQVMTEYSVLGMEHIWSGIDHLLFVFGLLLLVGGGKRLLWTITAFTAGHSITLSLVTLGYFDYPVSLVEFTIAVSIFVLALQLARRDDVGLFRRYPWWLAGGFGLLHGMGFAGALAEAGLPQDNVPLALLFFNVGIEVGQIAFIFAVLGLWYLFRKVVQPWQEQLMPVPVYVLGALSAMWCIERAMDVIG